MIARVVRATCGESAELVSSAEQYLYAVKLCGQQSQCGGTGDEEQHSRRGHLGCGSMLRAMARVC